MTTQQTHLFGRQREVQLLEERVAALRAGEGSVLLIAGEAGLGKSVLVDATLRIARDAGALVLKGGCYDLMTTPPYGPWLEMARYYRTDTQAEPPFSLSKAGIATVDGQVALFDDVTGFLTALAARGPLVIALEDLHWSDPASVDLLRVIARHAETIPLLLVVTYRADELDRNGPLYMQLPSIMREARAERVDLQPLDRATIGELVRARLGLEQADQARLVDYLERYSEGNPFYMDELLRGLENRQALIPAENGWQLGDIERVETPELLRQIIDSRMTGLEPDVHQRLAIGAVIGQDVPLDLWSAVLGVSDEVILETIEQALREQIIAAMQDGLSVRFRHALFRAALYESVLPPRRRMLHHAIAEALIASPTPDPDAVAWHLQQAHDERAAAWLIRAGERAQRAYAWTMAAERLSAAVERLSGSGSTRERGWLHYRIGRLRRHADSANAILWLQEAERLGNLSADAVLTAYARFDLGHILVLSGEFQRGLDRMLAADRLLESLPPDHNPPGSEIAAWVADALPGDEASRSAQASAPEGAVRNITRHGTLCQWLVEPGRLEEARAQAEPFVAAIERLPILDEQALSSTGDAWFGLGRVAAAQSDPRAAHAALDRAGDCYRRINHHLLIAGTLRVTLTEVVLPYETTDVARRRRLAAAAEDAYLQATGALPAHITPRFASLELLLLEGAWDEAAALLEPMTEHSRAMVTWRDRAIALAGRLACDRGDVPRAWECVRLLLPNGPQTKPGTATFIRAIEMQLVALDLTLGAANAVSARQWLESLTRWLAWSGATRWRADCLLGWARLCLLTGDNAGASRHAEAALDAAGEPRQPLALLAAHRLLGSIDTINGQHASAKARLAESLLLATGCAAPYERALTIVTLAELHRATGAHDTARDLLGEASNVFEQLGAQPALERATTLLAGLDADVVKPPVYGLSKRELEVLRLVAQGLTDAEVAEQLFISYRTVTTHLSSIFNKLGVSSRVSATRIAVKHDLV